MMHITSVFLVSLIVTTSVLRWTRAADEEPRGQKKSCSWTKVTAGGEAHHSFLLRTPSVPRLYHGVWSAQRALLSCVWSDDAAVVENYASLCQRARTGRMWEEERTDDAFSQNQDDENFDILPMFALCVAMTSSGSSPPGGGTDRGDAERTGKRQARSVDEDDDDAAPAAAPAAVAADDDDTAAAGSVSLVQSPPPLISQPDGPGSESSGSGVEKLLLHRRVKRFIVPGTLWCGSGNKALSYGDLGVFSETDSCCRGHDQCKNTILSFESRYGVFNRNIFTMSHCDCDNSFRRCLTAASDSISYTVGYTFFNLLKMHCFQFSHKLQCAERNWFGMCKEMKMALYADVYPPSVYEGTEPADEGNVTVNTATAITAITTANNINTAITANNINTAITNNINTNNINTTITANNINNINTTITANNINTTITTNNISTTISTQDKITTLTQESSPSVPGGASASTTSSALSATDSSLTSTATTIPPEDTRPLETADAAAPSITVSSRDLVNTLPTAGPRSTVPTVTPILPNGLAPPTAATPILSNGLAPPTEKDAADTDLSCDVYRDLDTCGFKISPQQRRYGLLNAEPRTLYHCSCTRRLFQRLVDQKHVTGAHAVLLGYVSQSCFLPQDCTGGRICTAALVKPALPLPHPGGASSGAGTGAVDVEEGRHLQAVTLKRRRPTTARRAKRKDRPVRLHRLCVRMTLPRRPHGTGRDSLLLHSGVHSALP